jgi:hypothetical protein
MLLALASHACWHEPALLTNIMGFSNGDPIPVTHVDGSDRVTFTESTVQGIRAGLATLFPDGSSPFATLTLDPFQSSASLRFVQGSVAINDAWVESPVNPLLLSLVPPIEVPVDPATIADLGVLHSSGGSQAFSLSFQFDGAAANAVSVGTLPFVPTGLYVTGAVEFGNDYLTEFSCDCKGGEHEAPLPDGGCQDLCNRFEDGLPTGFDGVGDCNVRLRSRVRRSRLTLGFRPRLPAPTTPSISGPLPGAERFHIKDMFSIDVTVNAILNEFVHDNFAAVETDVTNDVAVAASVDNGCAIICLTQDCETPLAEGFGAELAGTLEDALSSAIGSQLVPRFNALSSPQLVQCDLSCVGDDEPPGQEGTPCCDLDYVDALVSAALTYQKWSWFASPFGPYPNGSYLPILDLQQTAAGLDFIYDPDKDDDGIVSPRDNCFDDPNPVQIDLDGDGLGNPCDRCMLDPMNDEDRDGVCFPADNCAKVFNPGQENCNAYSEEAHEGQRLGDACDPVPCATSDFRQRFEEFVCPPTCSEAEKLAGICHESCPASSGNENVSIVCYETLSAEVEVRPLQSHPRVAGDAPVPVHDLETPIRFCQEQRDKGIFCGEIQDLADGWLSVSSCHDPAPLSPTVCALPERPEHRFLRMTFTAPEMANGVDPNGASAVLDYDLTPFDSPFPRLRWEWDFRSDFDRWLEGTVPALVEAPGGAEALKGNIWVHTVTEVGEIVDIGTGLHGAADPTQLSNNHNLGRDGQGVSLDGFAVYDPGQCIACVSFPDLSEFHPEGLASSLGTGERAASRSTMQQTLPHVVWRPRSEPIAGAHQRYDATDRESEIVMAFDYDLVGSFTGSETCDGQDVGPSVGPVLAQRLLSASALVVNAAEPFAHLGDGDHFPVAVVLDRATGSEILDTVITDGRELVAAGDAHGCESGPECAQCPTGLCIPGAPLVCCSSSGMPPGGAPALGQGCGAGGCSASGVGPNAVEFAAVLTSMRRGVFVVGGADPTTGLPTGEIWFSPLDEPTWKRVAIDFTLEHVLAATYGFASDELFILDESSDGQVRLWSVALDSRVSSLVASWSRHPAWDRHFLTIDGDGSLLVSTSRSGAARNLPTPPRPPGRVEAICHYPKTDLAAAQTMWVLSKLVGEHLAHGDTRGECQGQAIVRFAVEHGALPRVSGFSTNRLPLALPPVVDGDGYTLAREKRVYHGTTFEHVLERERLAALKLKATTLEALEPYQ